MSESPYNAAVAELVRKRLKQAAQRRDLNLARTEDIVDEIKSSVAAAQEAGIPMAEVARILHMDRSTLYRVYVDAA